MLSLFVLLGFITVNHSQEAFDPTAHENWHLLKNQNCGSNPTSRIVGGTNAELGEFPWIAYLMRQTQEGWGYSNCGGSIINKRTIVTAAHCVYGRNKKGDKRNPDAVLLGDWNQKTDPDCDERICAEEIQTINVTEILIPIKYHYYNAKRYDIALLRLAEDIQFNSYVWPICMPKRHLMHDIFGGVNAIAAGWGYQNSSTRERSTILRKVTLKVRDNLICEHVSRIFRREYQICAGGKEDTDICSGDSGGPLMRVEEIYGHPRTFLIGVASYGLQAKCGVKGFPSFFTRVSAFMSWILDNLVENKVEYYKV